MGRLERLSEEKTITPFLSLYDSWFLCTSSRLSFLRRLSSKCKEDNAAAAAIIMKEHYWLSRCVHQSVCTWKNSRKNKRLVELERKKKLTTLAVGGGKGK